MLKKMAIDYPTDSPNKDIARDVFHEVDGVGDRIAGDDDGITEDLENDWIDALNIHSLPDEFLNEDGSEPEEDFVPNGKDDDGEEEEDETFKWMAEKILEGVQTKSPGLEAFDEKITYLTKVKNDIS